MADQSQYYYTNQDDEYLDQDQAYYDYDQDQYPYDNSQERPSFTEYWKKSKDSESSSSRGQKNIRFVQTTVPGASSGSYSGGYASGTDADAGMGSDSYNTGSSSKDGQSSSSSKAAQDKAQLRRAQVRKAQIQHRQRKANYVKQLEQDVAGLRDAITTEQQEVEMLRGENDMMRSHVHHTMGGVHDPYATMPLGHDVPVSLPYTSDPATSQGLDYYSMNLPVDDPMRSSYRMTTSDTSSYYQTASPPSGADYYSRMPSNLTPLPDMVSGAQDLNYMLAPSHDPYSYPTNYKK
ncbi:hypothetical protein V8F20_007139 [Naviculisporaceae sp. PSN 640]